MQENKFERRFPVHQNAIEIFGDRWASKIERVYPGLTSGAMAMFDFDPRPSIAAQHLGLVPGSLHGMNVLELGPLEGAHTYQLAKLGANRILAIEANSEAFLKCLVVKDILQTPHCQFLLGDCLKFLQVSCDQFDMIFCSGILYHMENPFDMVKAISQRTDRVFLWTHYYDPDVRVEPERRPKKVTCDGLELTFYENAYGDPNYGRFWGGNMPTASWLSRDAIAQCFRYFGYDFTVHEDNRVHEYGPCLTATALRQKLISTLKTMPEDMMTNSSDRLRETVKAEAFLWGAEVAELYHGIAASHMDAQWDTIIQPILAQYSIDYSSTIDFAAGYGRNTRKLLDAGAEHVTMVDVNPDCVAHLINDFPRDRTTAVLTDGTSLSHLKTAAFTFLYTFDAMVHFDLEIVMSYIPEFARVLRPGAYAFVHHSNYTANPGGDFRENPHWRNFMSAAIFKHIAVRSGFDVIQQETFRWGEPDIDCITVLYRKMPTA